MKARVLTWWEVPSATDFIVDHGNACQLRQFFSSFTSGVGALTSRETFNASRRETVSIS
jgi:hypothetical protein